MTITRRDPLDRLAERLEIDEAGCWVDPHAPGSDGYPKFTTGSRTDESRRYQHTMTFAYDALVGDRHKSEVPDHLCRNKSCWNPDHLEAVTQRENLIRGDGVASKARWTHCPRGHEFTIENTVTAEGRRRCRTCCNMRARKYRARARERS